MTGLVTTRRGTFVFRDDMAADHCFWAWNIKDPHIGWRTQTHKWDALPRGTVTVFDIEDPPDTVMYLPILGNIN